MAGSGEGKPVGDTVTRTACSYCGVGCGMEVRTRADDDGRPVIARVSGDKLHPTNFGRLCTKGATHAEMMAATDGRLTTGLIRSSRDDEFTEASVDDAVAEAARRFKAIVDEHGPDSVALYVSGQMSIESQYVATKLAKGFLRTMHIESNSRLCMASAGTGYKQSLGADGPPGSYTDFDRADLFFVIGSNMADCHPILFLRMVDRLKAGAKLIVVDPRRTTTADRADLFLQIKPGTDLALLNGLLHLLVESGDVDEEFIAGHTQGWEDMPEFLADYPPERVAELTGLAEDDVRRAAAMIAEAGEWMTCWTMGLNQSTHGTWNTNAICNLHLATGAICRPGSGPMSLTGQPNAMGGREMGYMGPGLPGQRAVTVPGDREFVEQQWGLSGGTIRSDVGPGTIEMFSQMAEGDIKACWIICTNPVASVANRATVIAGLRRAELVITQDAYRSNATSPYADVMLPAALWAEADAVMVNSDRNLTLLSASIPPAGEARPDWQLICDVAAALGFGEHFDFASSEEVFDEIRRFWNRHTGWDLRGASYTRLRETPLQWPVPPADQPGGEDDRHPIRYLNDGVSQDEFTDDAGERPRLAFPTASRRAVFHARPHMDAAEMPDDDYPLVLNTGRLQHQWHTMTKTGRVAKLNKLNSGPFVELHPEDAAAADIVDGQPVELTSRRGRAVLPAVLTDRVRPGNCWVPFHWNDEHGEDLTINALTNDAVDPDSLQPEFKVCAVSMSPAGPAPSAEEDSGEPRAAGGMHPAAAALGLDQHPVPEFTEDEKHYLAGFFTTLPTDVPEPAVLPAGAPVRREVRLRVDGMIAGAHARPGAGDAAEKADDANQPDDGAGPAPLVMWASQTGNAEEFAGTVAERIGTAGSGVRLVNMDDCALSELQKAAVVVVVTSTFGEGGPPDNGADFWARLAADDAPELNEVRYAVLGIGDRSYDDFCGHAKSLDARLGELGASKLLDRTECEAYDDEPMSEWAQRITTLIADGEAAQTSADDAPSTNDASEDPAPSKDASGGTSASPAGAAPERKSAPFTRGRPVPAPLCRNEVLSAPGSAKEVRQFGFDLSEHDVAYGVGDSLGVHPLNGDRVVERWLAATGLSGSEVIEVDGKDVEMREALRVHFDLCRVSPGLLDFVIERCDEPGGVKTLRRNKSELEKWLVDRDGIDVVEQFRTRADPREWRDALVRLTPRSYSISSSPLVSPDEVQLTVSVVRYGEDDGKPRGGVCSTFLADRAEDPVPVFLQPSAHFKPPEDGDVPIVMVGPGTGIAPFRGFLQDRRARGHTGANWLFFGDQHASKNFYYRSELEDMFRDGFLDELDLAFSRDGDKRVYVQHRMREHGARLWRWLDEGAFFYVCGDANRMAKDVDAALVEIIAKHGGMSDEDAREYKKDLVSAKRYVRDVY